MGVHGLDVSHHQGAVDWPQVARAGYRFAFCKATESTTYVDPTHQRNLAGAASCALLVGSYHYGKPGRNAPVSEARFFAKTMGALGAGRLAGVLDLEETGGLTRTALRAYAKAFLTELDRLTGRSSILYTGAAFWRDQLAGFDLAGRPLWLARYNTRPPADAYDFWQHTSSGAVPGIAGPCDLNVYAGSVEQLQALAGVKAPAPKPKPDPFPPVKPLGEPMPPDVHLGDRGPRVRRLQALLFACGFLPVDQVEAPDKAVVGPKTAAAIRKARGHFHLPASSTADAHVWRGLLGLHP